MRADRPRPARPPLVDHAVRIDQKVVADVAPRVRERVVVPDVANFILPVDECVRAGGVMHDGMRNRRVRRCPSRRSLAVGTGPLGARANLERAVGQALLDVGPALKRAIARVEAGEPALLDTVMQPR